MIQKDNSTFYQKLRLRETAIAQLETPVILETHGGNGELYNRVYWKHGPGIVLEKDPTKTQRLAEQRPHWAVYECTSEKALDAGIGSHLPINFLDVDPYGNPWVTIQAFMFSDRPKVPVLQVVVNDGQRQATALNVAWKCNSLKEAVQEFGNDLHGCYLEVCKVLMHKTAAESGYRLNRWAGYYCGRSQGMTHYWAELLHEG